MRALELLSSFMDVPEVEAIHAHHSPVVVTNTDTGWTTRPDGTSQGGQLVFKANSELLQGRESNMSLISWHSSRLRRVARSSSAAESQAAVDGDDEAVYIRLCLKEVLFGQLDVRNWQSETRQIPAALVVDCRGVYDALARSSSFSWSKRQEIWLGGTCAQTEFRE